MMKNTDMLTFFDNHFDFAEQLPKEYVINFNEVKRNSYSEMRVTVNNQQFGDVINDNSYTDDFYRYHDIFHFTFAALLGWSPCTRAMLKRKRKSDSTIDRIEDGARAIITEESISMIIFTEAKRKKYFENVKKVSKTTLKTIKELTNGFEVRNKTAADWEDAIIKSYEVFRFLIKNKGGTVKFDALHKHIQFGC